MVEQDKIEELERQLDIWSGAYHNLDNLNFEIANLDIRRGIIYEQIESETSIKDNASKAINSIVDSIEDSEENNKLVKSILNKHIADVIIDGFVQ